MFDPQTLLLSVLLPPFISFALNGLIPPLRKSKYAAALAIFSVFISTLASLILLIKRPGGELIFEWIPAKLFSPFLFGFFLDPFSIVMFFIVSLVALIVQVYSLGYMSEENPSGLGRYYTFHSLFAFSMLGFVASSSLLQIYIFWELVGLCSYLLIGFWYYKPEASRAAVKAFWVTRFGDVGFAIGMVILWGATGTFFLSELFVKAPELPTAYLSLCMLLIFFGAMGKSAQFPLHVWLPDAMEGPTPVSALIHAATMVVAGVYLVARLIPLFEVADGTLLIITIVGLITALITGFMAIAQTDIKKVLAYSTVGQLGFMFVALGTGQPHVAMAHLMTHAFFKALLFLGTGSVIHATHHHQEMDELGGLWRKMPITAATFFVGSLALAGLPPLAGYWGKGEIFVVLNDKWCLGALLPPPPAAVIPGFYTTRLFIRPSLGEPRDRHIYDHTHESPPV